MRSSDERPGKFAAPTVPHPGRGAKVCSRHKMVKIDQTAQVHTPAGAPALRNIRFSNKRLDPVGIEVLTLSELCRRVPSPMLQGPQRVEFFMLMVVTRGLGAHHVDFDRMDLTRGRAVFVRPGQVQEWALSEACDAYLVLIEPAALQTRRGLYASAAMGLLRLEEWPTSFDLDVTDLSTCEQLATLLRRELAPAQVPPVSAALARELLLCALLAVSRAALRSGEGCAASNPLAQRFTAELERRVMLRPGVEELAQSLGVSASTLNRACQARFGNSAKVMIDRRVALEAQRLLVHTEAASVAIGEQLGFSEPTNFLKFFRRRVGTTPEAFRRGLRPALGA